MFFSKSGSQVLNLAAKVHENFEFPHRRIKIGGIERGQIKNFNESPIDKTDAIVKGNYPILILCAELDDAAVNSQNAFPFEKKMKEKGGDITVIVKKGFKHHPHSFPNPAYIVDFIEKAVNKDAFLLVKKYDSYKGLVMAGYQAWFSCPDDGAGRGWYHYLGRDGSFRPGSCKVDMWPDVSEYDKIYKTEADLGSDYYLYLAGQAGRMLRKEIPFTERIPVR